MTVFLNPAASWITTDFISILDFVVTDLFCRESCKLGLSLPLLLLNPKTLRCSLCEPTNPVETPSRFRKCPINCHNLKYNRFLRPLRIIEHPSTPSPPTNEPESSCFTNRRVKKPASPIPASSSQLPLPALVFPCHWGWKWLSSQTFLLHP